MLTPERLREITQWAEHHAMEPRIRLALFDLLAEVPAPTTVKAIATNDDLTLFDVLPQNRYVVIQTPDTWEVYER